MAQNDLKSLIVAAHLDSPAQGTVCANDGVELLISGWVVPKDASSHIEIIVRVDRREISRIPLSINRPDVRRRILGDDSGIPLVCGFRGSETLDAEAQVCIQISKLEFLWKIVSFEDVDPHWLEETIGIWRSFVLSKDINITNASRLADIQSSVIDSLFLGTIKSCHDVKGFLAISGLPPEKLGDVESFFNLLQARSLPCDLVAAAISGGAAALINPFSGNTALCTTSWLVSNGINTLLFRDMEEIFILFQHVTSVDAVYFPRRNLVVLRNHITVNDVRSGVHQLVKNATQTLVRPKTRSSFGGVIASHGRPYHFYYDVAPALQLIHESGLLEKLPAVFMLEGADYFSMKSLYGFKADEMVLSAAELNKTHSSENRFLIQVGIQFGNSTRALVESFDSRLISALPGLLSADLKSQLTKAHQCFPLIWFGVTGQKRAWNEQVEAAILLVNSIAKAFPGMGICFDGWTSPLNPTQRDSVESAQDSLLVARIRREIPESIPVFDLVGANSVQKIAFAQLIDLFVANYATGSMHVARFAGKPGLGHISNSMDCSGHIHKRTRRVPSADVVDVLASSKLRPDFVSYSISPEVAVRMVTEMMKELPLVELRMEATGCLPDYSNSVGTS